jgi:hypothetical protein
MNLQTCQDVRERKRERKREREREREKGREGEIRGGRERS